MALPSSSKSVTLSTPAAKQHFRFAFIMVTSLFFFWGFIHNLDPVLIPHLRRNFNLSIVEASLVDSAVYMGYFIMAIPAGILMKKLGYKSGILIGLCLFSIGCFLFIPAANTMMYGFFLAALFIVACGLAMLETAANPYATVLGDPKTATQRLNFAQSFNGLAAFLAPLLGGKLIFGDHEVTEKQVQAMSATAQRAFHVAETATVKLPYTVLAIVILVIAAIFVFTKLPDIKDEDEVQEGGFFHAFKHRQLAWGVVAQFFYVGAQVCILSLLILFASKATGLTDTQVKGYSGAAGLAFMLGRFAGTFLMQYIRPAKLLFIYSLLCVALCGFVIAGHGISTVYAMIGIAFFMSIMFPTIFALAIEGIGSDTKSGSSFLVMSIVGGAALPPALGAIADKTGNLNYGYIVPLIAFAVVGYFAWSGHKHAEKAVERLQ